MGCRLNSSINSCYNNTTLTQNSPNLSRTFLKFNVILFIVITLQKTVKNLKDNLKRCLDKRKAMLHKHHCPRVNTSSNMSTESNKLDVQYGTMIDFSAEIKSIQQQSCQPQPSPVGSNSSFDSALTSPLPPSNKYKRKSNSTINDDSLLTHLQRWMQEYLLQ